VLGAERGEGAGHKPVYADREGARYGEVGIGDRIATAEGRWNLLYDDNVNRTNDAKIMEYFAAFAATLEDASGVTDDEALDLAQQMYVAYYGRPADPDGHRYWADQFQASDDLTYALDAFGNSPEYQQNYAFLSSSELVNNLYQQMFSRDADPAGLDFYMNRLETGEASLASIAKQIADGAINDDWQALDNKIDVSEPCHGNRPGRQSFLHIHRYRRRPVDHRRRESRYRFTH